MHQGLLPFATASPSSAKPVLSLLVRLLQSSLPAVMTKEPKIALALQTLLETGLGQSVWPVTHRPVWASQPGAALHPRGLVCLAFCTPRMTMSPVSLWVVNWMTT